MHYCSQEKDLVLHCSQEKGIGAQLVYYCFQAKKTGALLF